MCIICMLLVMMHESKLKDITQAFIWWDGGWGVIVG